VELQEIDQKIHASQNKAQKFKEIMSTLPLIDVVTTMAENKNIYLEINQLRIEQHACAQKIEVLQEESYKVTMDFSSTQGMVKHVSHETAKNLKTPLNT
jgi:hypothetical protein